MCSLIFDLLEGRLYRKIKATAFCVWVKYAMTKHLQLPHLVSIEKKILLKKKSVVAVWIYTVSYQSCSPENLVQILTDCFLLVCLFVCLFVLLFVCLFVFSLLMSVPSKWLTILLKSSKMEQTKPSHMVLSGTLQQPWESQCCVEFLHTWWWIQITCLPSLRQQLQEVTPSYPISVSPEGNFIFSLWFY